MDIDFNLLNENSFWAVPLVIAITEVFKMTGFNAKFAPMISLVMGLGMSILINIELGLSQAIVSGIIYGLSASGLYSGVKTTSNIRGRVPLRTNKEPVKVQQIEVETPLSESTISANEQINVSETISASSNQQSNVAKATVQEKPIEKVEEVNVKEMNVKVDNDPLK